MTLIFWLLIFPLLLSMVLWSLEQFPRWCSEAITSVADVIGTLGRREGIQGRAHRRPQARHRTRGDRAQAGFEFRKDLLNGIEVRAVGGQREQVGADGFNRLADPGHFMTGQIVEDDAVARLEGGGEDLFTRRHKGGAIDRPVKDRGGGELVGAERGNARRRLPLAVGDLRHEARAAPTAARAPGHLCLQRGLVEEDEPLPVPLRGLPPPVLPGHQDIRPLLFGGVQDFFLPSGQDAAQPARPW